MNLRIRKGNTVMAVLASAFLAACGDDGTGPGETGRASAVVTDAPDAPASAVVPAGNAAVVPAAVAGSFSGTLAADAQVFISADGKSWVKLGEPAAISLALQSSGDTTDVHGTAEVPVGTYAYVRLVLENARATLNAGSLIGGTTLTVAVDVTLGTGRVVIEKEVEPFTISADARTTIIFDMNSEGWVTEENANDKQVSEEEVQQPSNAETRRDMEQPV